MTTQTMPSIIDQLGEAALAAREATREAHEATKDLRAASKEAREAEASLRRALAEAADDVADEALAGALSAHAEEIAAGITHEVDTINGCLSHIAQVAGVHATLLVRSGPA